MKIVVTDYEFPNLKPEADALKDLPGVELIEGKCTNEEELIAACKDADGILNQWNRLTARVIGALDKCKVISTYGIGVDKIDVAAATRKGIYVCNSPEYNKFEVANHTVMMILALSRQLVQLDRLMRDGKYGWYQLDHEMYRLQGQTAGFIGYGRIARQVAGMLKAFEVKSACYDPFLTAEQCAAAGAKKMELDEVLKRADFVSINVSLTKETYHMIGAQHLSLMKSTAYLVNCGRGAIVDEEALVQALRAKKIAGAALDTFETEPIAPPHPLMKLDNVIMTPHSAWHTKESMWEMQWVAARQAALVLKNEKPDYCVNYEAVQKPL